MKNSTLLHAKINMRGQVQININIIIKEQFSNPTKPIDYWLKKHSHMLRDKLIMLNNLLKPSKPVDVIEF